MSTFNEVAEAQKKPRIIVDFAVSPAVFERTIRRAWQEGEAVGIPISRDCTIPMEIIAVTRLATLEIRCTARQIHYPRPRDIAA